MMIHSALVSQQSASLQNLVSGPMKEAQAKSALWDDIDMDTFVHFAEYVYTGDYSSLSVNRAESLPGVIYDDISPFRPVSGLEAVTVNTPFGEAVLESERTSWPSFGSIPAPDPLINWELGPKYRLVDKKTQKRSQQQAAKTYFFYLKYPLPPVPFSLATASRSHPQDTAAKANTLIFLRHARLYVFAEKWGIEALKMMALHKLHKTLCSYAVDRSRYSVIIDLVKYTYDNTPSRKPRDPLRELVTNYIAYEAKDIARSEQCLDLVQDVGDFARDLLSMVTLRGAF